MSPNDFWPDMPAQSHSGAPPRWLLSFIDLTAILVVFFVLIFSVNQMNSDQWKEFNKRIEERFGAHHGLDVRRPDSFDNAKMVKKPKNKNALEYLEGLFNQRLGTDPVWGGIKAQKVGNGKELAYKIPAVVWEGDGLSAEGTAAVMRLAAVLRNWDNRLILRTRSTTPRTMLFAAPIQTILVTQGVAAFYQAEWEPLSDVDEEGVFLVVQGGRAP